MKQAKLYPLALIACLLGYCWLFFSQFISSKASQSDFTICIFKRITTIPCPSCGTTRAINHLFHGEILASILLNPFGIVVAAIMIVAPLWILFDYFTQQQSFYNFYIASENTIKTKKVAIPLIILVILNWIWNIYKHL
jgi:hypothetical protein